MVMAISGRLTTEATTLRPFVFATRAGLKK
jgi:hypothetical protein